MSFLEIFQSTKFCQTPFIDQSAISTKEIYKLYDTVTNEEQTVAKKKRKKTDLWSPSENSYHRLEPALLPSPSQELASSCLSIHHRILVHTIDSGGS